MAGQQMKTGGCRGAETPAEYASARSACRICALACRSDAAGLLKLASYSASPSVGKVRCLLHRITSTSTSNPVSNEGAVAEPCAARSLQDWRAPDRLRTGI